jgi:hypothetical protein
MIDESCVLLNVDEWGTKVQRRKMVHCSTWNMKTREGKLFHVERCVYSAGSRYDISH